MSKTNLIAAAMAGIGLAGTAGATVLPAPAVIDSAPPYSASYAASNSVDNTELDYASASQGVNTFLEYSFGAPATFDKIVVVNRNSPGQSDLIGDFTVTFDGASTSSVFRTPERGSSLIHSLGGPVTATNVRLDVDTIGTGDAYNNTGAQEVLFVQTPAGQTPISGVTVMNSSPAFAALYAADNAVDGVVGLATAGTDGPEYASATQGVNTFLEFDLGAVMPIGGFDLFDRIADDDRVTAFTLTFSEDAVFDGSDVTKSYSSSTIATSDIFAPVKAQFIRFDVDAHNPASANTGVSEITFYQVPEPGALGLLALAIPILARRRHGR